MAADLHSGADSEDEAIAAINIIPFVDIVLVLLVIFMLTSSAIVKASLKVDLPRAASAGESVTSTLNIVLTREGALYLNGDATTDQELAATVRSERATHPQLQAVIAADTRAEYGQVVAVIDLVKQNGVASFALNLEPDVRGDDARL